MDRICATIHFLYCARKTAEELSFIDIQDIVYDYKD